MGNLHSKLRKGITELFSAFKGKKKASLAILGLDSSGKSTLVNLFRDTDIPTVPTLGFNVEEIVVNNITIKIWDVGGQKAFISYWKDYVEEIDGLVFMIDIADEGRFEKSFEAFRSLVDNLKDGLPVLLLLNKSDLLDSTQAAERQVDRIKEIYGVQGGYGSSSILKAGDKNFKARIHYVSVKNDLQKMSGSTSKWVIQDASVFPGFNLLLEDIKAKENSTL